MHENSPMLKEKLESLLVDGSIECTLVERGRVMLFRFLSGGFVWGGGGVHYRMIVTRKCSSPRMDMMVIWPI